MLNDKPLLQDLFIACHTTYIHNEYKKKRSIPPHLTLSRSNRIPEMFPFFRKNSIKMDYVVKGGS